MQSALPDAVVQVSFWVGDWTVIVAPERLFDVAQHLRAAGFDFLNDLTAVDWPPRAARFDVVYCLTSIAMNQRVRLKARLADQAPIRSVTPIWPSANWLEREVFDMFGIVFEGHPDPRRILMPEEWQGYPQRKDYPLEGPGELLLESPDEWLKLQGETRTPTPDARSPKS